MKPAHALRFHVLDAEVGPDWLAAIERAIDEAHLAVLLVMALALVGEHLHPAALEAVHEALAALERGVLPDLRLWESFVATPVGAVDSAEGAEVVLVLVEVLGHDPLTAHS